jgi:hypothetical protein
VPEEYGSWSTVYGAFQRWAVAVVASGLSVAHRAGELPGAIGWTVREGRDPAIR